MKRIVLISALALVAVGTAILAVRPWHQTATQRSGASATYCATLPQPTGVQIATTAHSACPQQSETPKAPAAFPGLVQRLSDWRDYTPKRITVEVSPGCPVEFDHTRTESIDGRTVWVGSNATAPGSCYVGVATADTYFATVSIPGADDHSIYIRGDQVAEFDRISGTCTATAGNALAAAANVSIAADAATSTVDVLFCYREEARVYLNDTDANVRTYLEDQAIALITQCNQYLAQSGVDNLRWRSLGVVKIANAAAQSTMAAELSAFATDPTTISAMQDRAADQAVLFVPSQRGSETGVAGVAQCPGNFAAVGMFAGAEVYAHELAHNFGCHHDRTNPAAGDNAADGDGQYYYGYQGTYNGQTYGTIMAYTGRLPYFSTSSLTIGSATVIAGTSDQLTIGVAAGQPRAADNARWLREHAASMAATRSPATAPAITSQPANASITTGQTLSLSVTATGGNLSYQWAKDGISIQGATSATYSKANSTTADSGSYSVVVTNTAGTITSNTATVTVSAASNPNNGGGSGGGGGGGAVSPSCLCALAALAGLRALRRKR